MAELVDRLLSRPGAARVAFWLWMHPGYHTAEEIQEGIRWLSPSRIQQILRWMRDRKLIDIQTRDTGRPGPAPYEYCLVLRLIEALRKETR